MSNKEKRKGNPRRRVYLGLASILFLVVAVFFIAPFAEDRLQEWLADDPFTPMCDAGNLELAFVRDSELFSIRGDGSEYRLIPLVMQNPTDLSWSPDGQLLAVTYKSSVESRYADSLIILQWEMPQLYHNLESHPHSEIHSLSWSEDSNYLFYAFSHRANGDLQTDLRVWDAPEDLQWPVGMTKPSVFVPVSSNWTDDNLLIYVADESYIASLQLPINFRETWIKELVGLGNRLSNTSYLDIYVSPDNEAFAYIDSKYNIVIRDIISGELLKRYENEGYGRLRGWTPYGLLVDLLKYDEKNEHFILSLVAIDTKTNERKYITSSLTGLMGFIAMYSADGENILYRKSDEAYWLFNVETSEMIQVPQYHWQISEQAWTPDNRYLSYQGKNNWLYLLDLESYQSCRVIDGGENGITRYDWRIIPD